MTEEPICHFFEIVGIHGRIQETVALLYEINVSAAKERLKQLSVALASVEALFEDSLVEPMFDAASDTLVNAMKGRISKTQDAINKALPENGTIEALKALDADAWEELISDIVQRYCTSN